MAEYLYPGTYVEEKKFGNPPVTGGSTSTGAFVGFTPRGPVGEPFFVTSWTEFVNKTSLGVDSPFLKDSYLAYAVYGFFNNGGKRAWIVRATDGTEAKATIEIINGAVGSEQPIIFTAKEAGEWANALSIKVSENVDFAGTYDVEILKDTAILEVHKQLVLDSSAENSLVGRVNQNSNYVSVETSATIVDASTLATHKLLGGTDGLSNVTDTNLTDAMRKFDGVDSINLLVIPESQSQTVTSDALAYCEKRKDCVFIADAGMNDDFASVQEFKKLQFSDFGALYFPWVEVTDPIGTVKKNKFIPTAGHVAGAIARIDSERGVFKAPAGTEAVLRGVVGVKTKINDQEQGVLNPKGINVIRSFPDAGIVIWGARTLSNNYLNVRRELNLVMNSILNSTKWAVFEANNAELWRKIRNTINEFLLGRYNLGAYKGATPEEAFFVKCDGELNTKAEIDAGRVNTEVGIATNKPGEFVIFRVGQWEGGGEAQ